MGHRAWFFSRISPCCGPCGYRHGGWGRRGGGTCPPSPVSHAPTILLLAGLPRPACAFANRLPRCFCRPPHPARACGAPPPPPPRGRWQCVVISGEQPYPGCSRWEAVSGSSPAYPHALDRGNIALGGGADGEGELVPPPLSPTLQTPCSLPALSRPRLHEGYPCSSAGLPHPARAFARGYPYASAGLPRPACACGKGYPCTFAGTPTPPAPAALLPRPRRRGGGSAW